jgi:glyoxylase-like metal-dependent hydrolase (beta-lactamase superfamily II)
MGMKNVFVSEIAKNTYAINEYGLTAMYLLVGEEKALLLDTGCGVCDIKKLVEELIDKPYIVALTHGHLDHAGGIGAFDEIYLGKGDFEMASSVSAEELRGYADDLGKMGGYAAYDYKPEWIKQAEKLPVMHAIEDGDIFSLGNRDVRAIAVPGHTQGGICFLDKTSGILFSGDACNTNLLVCESSVNTTLRGLDYLKTFDGQYKQMFNGHIGYAGLPNCFSQPETVLDDCIQICEQILGNTGNAQSVNFLGRSWICQEYGCARISYDPERLYDPGETPVR